MPEKKTTTASTPRAGRPRTAHVLFTRAQTAAEQIAFTAVTNFGDRNKALEALDTTHRGQEYIALPFGDDLAETLRARETAAR